MLETSCLFWLISGYFLFRAFSLGLKSQRELDRIFADNGAGQQSLTNVFMASRALPYGLSALSFLVGLLCFFQWMEGQPLTRVWVAVLSIYVVFCTLLVLGALLAVKMQNSGREGRERLLSRRWASALYPFVPENIRTFRMEETVTAIPLKRPRGDRSESMLKGILQFGNETVRDIMTSRLDMVAIDIRTPFHEVVRLISENSYSRVPVFSGTRDNIVGVLYIKDVLPYVGKPSSFRWSSLIRPHLSVPETKKIDNLLREFQSRKIHLALVIDEYGGVSGVVTLEDIIEEIVGEINDEYDDDHHPYVMLGSNTYIFDAKTSLQDFCKLFNLDSDFFDQAEGDADSLAGLLLDLVGDIPEKHQMVDYRQFRFEVLEVDERHIAKLKVSLIPTPAS